MRKRRDAFDAETTTRYYGTQELYCSREELMGRWADGFLVGRFMCVLSLGVVDKIHT